jgi:hypothetical protein
MDAIELLRQQVLDRRNAAILAANREYHAALKEIASLARRLGIKRPGRPPKPTNDNSGVKPTAVAKEILSEGKPMTLTELTIEVQRRGCRASDDPRAVAHALDSGLRYHKREFKRDAEGRWTVA